MKGHERSSNPQAAVALNKFMRKLSQDYWCAGWLSGLDMGLWNVREGKQRTFGSNGEPFEGMSDLPLEDVATLRRLSEECAGWWRWRDEDDGEVFVNFDEWHTYLRDVEGSRRASKSGQRE